MQMRNYRIKIELLSDMCVSDGGIYNSAIDTDICYDEYGFPTFRRSVWKAVCGNVP